MSRELYCRTCGGENFGCRDCAITALGFTPEDVAELRAVAAVDARGAHVFTSLADRIAALLPPR